MISNVHVNLTPMTDDKQLAEGDTAMKSASDILTCIAATLSARTDIDQELATVLISHLLVSAPASNCVQESRNAIMSLATERAGATHNGNAHA